MGAFSLELKEYQQAALDTFREYLALTTLHDAETAYVKVTKNPFRPAPKITDGTPYVCLRIPTGGGKTIVAASSIGIAASELLQVPNPMVLWLVPSTAILEQTITALMNVDHPYRVAVAKDFGQNVTVLSKSSALAVSRADAEGGACIIVSTIQSFRREKENGTEDRDGLKAYQDAGALMAHFSGLSESQVAHLESVDGGGRPIASLANLLRLHRPMVIVDEAHNARTTLSFDTLARFNPSLILEITATPQTVHNPGSDQYASNVLYSASAAELKAEQMIKMPISLTTDRDWQKTVGAALDCRDALEAAAKAETKQTGEYIRPIILFQAQSASRNDPNRLTFHEVERFLIEDKGIHKSEIAVHSGARKDLDSIPCIADSDCLIRYIITVQKLKEGWDCPFAYVLCSVAEQTSATAIEQILGRVIRMPGALLKNRPALNNAYAFVASTSFHDAAQRLKDGLVDGAGFNREEVDSLVIAQGDLGYEIAAAEVTHTSDSLDGTDMNNEDIVSAIERLPLHVRSRMGFDKETRTFTYIGPMTKEAKNRIHLALAKEPKAATLIDKLYAKTNNYQASEAGMTDKPPFIVPLLGFRKQGELQPFSQEHFFDDPWKLHKCDASKIVNRFHLVDQSEFGKIDVTGQGKVEIRFTRRLQSDLAMVVHEPAWDESRLVEWLDNKIEHPDITKPSAVLFLNAAIRALIESGRTLDEIARNKFDLCMALKQFINELRSCQQADEFKALFATHADQFATSAELSVIFNEDRYAYNTLYSGATKFNKHYTTIVGDLKHVGEEFDCACYLDSMKEVRYWIRNVPQKRTSFWLQLPNHKFYPDFVALLKDGRILVVEYKGKRDYDMEQSKRDIGAFWAEASKGKCLFCMPTDRGFDEIDRVIQSGPC